MPRVGTPVGCDADTQLYLSFRSRTATDWSTNGHTVTVAGSPSYADGYFGEGVRFGSSSDYLSVADHASINFGTDFTVEAWINLESASVNAYIFNRQGASNDAWCLYIDTSRILTLKVWNDAQSMESITAPDAIQLNRWTHVRATYDSTAGWMYLMVDGAIVATLTTANSEIETASLAALEIGVSTTTGSTGNFVGTLSDIRLRDEPDITVASCSPNIRPAAITRLRMLSSASQSCMGSSYSSLSKRSSTSTRK